MLSQTQHEKRWLSRLEIIIIPKALNINLWSEQVIIQPMRGKNHYLVVLLLISAWVGTPVAPQAAEAESPPVVINEVAWAGGSLSSLDEWIELYNPTADTRDLSNWQITINTLTVTLPAESYLSAGGFYLIAKYKDDHSDSVLNIAVDLDREGKQFSIPNGGFTITLTNAAGEVVDVAWDGSVPTLGAKGISIERKDPTLPGDQPANWQEASSAINFDEGVPDFGTPKAPNSEAPPPPPAPQVNAISPTEAESETLFELEEISGEAFSVEPQPQIELVKGSLVISAQTIQNITPTLISGVQFDLTGAETGIYDLIVRNPDGQEGKLPAALIISEPTSFDNSDGILVSEILPQPESGAENEFIELHNTLARPVNLKGWQIDDSEGGSHPFQIESDLIIAAFGYLAFHKSETKIALNDAGDSGRLIKPNGTEAHRTPNYGTAKAGRAWALFGSEFKWTQLPTPGGANTLVVDQAGVELSLEADEIQTESLILSWTISGRERIEALSLWQQSALTASPLKLTDLPPTATDFKVKNLLPQTTYYFKLQAALQEGGERESALIQVTTLSAALSPPTLQPAAFAINEILPNPSEGEEEFIELINRGPEAAELKGYQLKDAAGKTFIIGEQVSTAALIPAGGIVFLTQTLTKIYLNNAGPESLYLLAPDGTVISQISYGESAPEGVSLALGADGEYYWTVETTPGETNLIITQAMLSAQEEENDETAPTSPALPASLPATGSPLGWLNLVLALHLLYLLYVKEVDHQNAGRNQSSG